MEGERLLQVCCSNGGVNLSEELLHTYIESTALGNNDILVVGITFPCRLMEGERLLLVCYFSGGVNLGVNRLD